MSSRRVRHEEPEEHENHERWLVSYADMVTLLMVLFVVMFAISQVDEKKFAELKDGLAAGFGSQDSILNGASSLHDQPGEGAIGPVAPQLNLSGLSENQRTMVQQALQVTERLEHERVEGEAEAEVKRLEKLRKRLLKALQRSGLERDVEASYDERGLVLSLVSRHVVFEADLASLSPRGQQVVDALARVLATVPDPLQIDGHTNQEPVRPRYFATDWDLSAARATTVLRRLNEVAGIATTRLSLAAFGHTRPLRDPAAPGSQEINKRVDIVVLSRVTPETAEMIPAAAGDRGRTWSDDLELAAATTDGDGDGDGDGEPLIGTAAPDQTPTSQSPTSQTPTSQASADQAAQTRGALR
ncbi:MAG: flagellar motor protein MotB [Nocardioides sp.]